MPTLATPYHPHPSALIDSLSSGISEASQELCERTSGLLDKFYGRSVRLRRVYPSPWSPIVFDSTSVAETAIRETLKVSMSRLDVLLTWTEGWDGNDAAALDPDAIEHAREWITQMFRASVTVGCLWMDPNITGSSDGEVVFEWWNGKKKLTVYVSADGAEYVKVWGLDINNEMADGSADTLSDRQNLWLWLTA